MKNTLGNPKTKYATKGNLVSISETWFCDKTDSVMKWLEEKQTRNRLFN